MSRHLSKIKGEDPCVPHGVANYPKCKVDKFSGSRPRLHVISPLVILEDRERGKESERAFRVEAQIGLHTVLLLT